MPEADEHEHLTLADVDYDVAAAIASRAILRDVRLAFTQAHRNLANVPEDWGQRAFIGFDSHAGDWDADARTFEVRVKFIAAFGPGWDPDDPVDEPDEPQIGVNVDFVLDYELSEADETVDPSALEH